MKRCKIGLLLLRRKVYFKKHIVDLDVDLITLEARKGLEMIWYATTPSLGLVGLHDKLTYRQSLDRHGRQKPSKRGGDLSTEV